MFEFIAYVTSANLWNNFFGDSSSLTPRLNLVFELKLNLDIKIDEEKWSVSLKTVQFILDRIAISYEIRLQFESIFINIMH